MFWWVSHCATRLALVFGSGKVVAAGPWWLYPGVGVGEELRRIRATVKAWLQQPHVEVCVDRTGFRSDRRVVAQTKYRESFERMAKSLRLWTACPRSTSQQTSQTDSPVASRILPATRRLPLFR